MNMNGISLVAPSEDNPSAVYAGGSLNGRTCHGDCEPIYAVCWIPWDARSVYECEWQCDEGHSTNNVWEAVALYRVAEDILTNKQLYGAVCLVCINSICHTRYGPYINGSSVIMVSHNTIYGPTSGRKGPTIPGLGNLRKCLESMFVAVFPPVVGKFPHEKGYAPIPQPQDEPAVPVATDTTETPF